MGDLLGSLVWRAKSGQYCVIGSGLLQFQWVCTMFILQANDMESLEHLFFECSFGHCILKARMHYCAVDNPPSCWEEVMSLDSRNWKGNSQVLSSLVYNLWNSRNEIKHSGHPKTEE
jgi:hypothetical protein